MAIYRIISKGGKYYPQRQYSWFFGLLKGWGGIIVWGGMGADGDDAETYEQAEAAINQDFRSDESLKIVKKPFTKCSCCGHSNA